jgi:hypothetical protein
VPCFSLERSGLVVQIGGDGKMVGVRGSVDKSTKWPKHLAGCTHIIILDAHDHDWAGV